LHERKEDIYALTRAFMARQGRAELTASVPFWFALLHHDWPYNVRELEAAIKRAIALSSGQRLELELLPDAVREAVADYGQPAEERGPVMPSEEHDVGAGLPAEHELRALLERHAGNVAAVGRELGKARMQIHRWMKRYGIEVDDYRR
jgi:DNA-binding NtrC family response regulator